MAYSDVRSSEGNSQITSTSGRVSASLDIKSSNEYNDANEPNNVDITNPKVVTESVNCNGPQHEKEESAVEENIPEKKHVNENDLYNSSCSVIQPLKNNDSTEFCTKLDVDSGIANAGMNMCTKPDDRLDCPLEVPDNHSRPESAIEEDDDVNLVEIKDGEILISSSQNSIEDHYKGLRNETLPSVNETTKRSDEDIGEKKQKKSKKLIKKNPRKLGKSNKETATLSPDSNEPSSFDPFRSSNHQPARPSQRSKCSDVKKKKNKNKSADNDNDGYASMDSGLGSNSFNYSLVVEVPDYDINGSVQNSCMKVRKTQFKRTYILRLTKISNRFRRCNISFKKQVSRSFEKQTFRTLKSFVTELHISYQVREVFILGSYYVRLNSDPPPSVEEQMRYEWLRLASFRNYGGNGNAIHLARHGFYHNCSDDTNSTRCVYCNMTYTSWEYFDDIGTVHGERSPNCPYHNNSTQVNVPIHNEPPQSSGNNSSTSETDSNTDSAYMLTSPSLATGSNARFSPTVREVYFGDQVNPMADPETVVAGVESSETQRESYHYNQTDAVPDLDIEDLGVSARVSNITESLDHLGAVGANRNVQVNLDAIHMLRQKGLSDEYNREHILALRRINVTNRDNDDTPVYSDINMTSEDHDIDAVARSQSKFTTALADRTTVSRNISSNNDNNTTNTHNVPTSAETPQASKEDASKLQAENKKLKAMRTCRICMDFLFDTTLLPCGHLVCCEKCAQRLKYCPICRKKILGTVKTLWS